MALGFAETVGQSLSGRRCPFPPRLSGFTTARSLRPQVPDCAEHPVDIRANTWLVMTCETCGVQEAPTFVAPSISCADSVSEGVAGGDTPSPGGIPGEKRGMIYFAPNVLFCRLARFLRGWRVPSLPIPHVFCVFFHSFASLRRAGYLLIFFSASNAKEARR